jgi:hypothetical protein
MRGEQEMVRGRPAYAKATEGKLGWEFFDGLRMSGRGEGWIPACAGMTKKGGNDMINNGLLRCGAPRNDKRGARDRDCHVTAFLAMTGGD